MPSSEDLNFWELARSSVVVSNALKVALVVGSILAAINYGDKFFLGTMMVSDYLKLVISYIVPYAVSTYSAVKTLQK